MRGLQEYIIENTDVLKKEVEFSTGDKLYVDPTFDQRNWTNRICKVISTPVKHDSPIDIGDEVLVIDTVLFTHVGKNMAHKKSQFLMDEEKGWYRIPRNLIVMYRKKGDEWKCYGQNLLVEPIPEKMETDSGLIIVDVDYKKEQREKNTKKQHGKVVFINNDLEDLGVEIGDVIVYKDQVDYRFKLDGEVFFHLENVDVLGKVEKNLN